MKRRAVQVTLSPLVREACTVTNPQGRELLCGGIEFSGVLRVRDIPVADFRNDGRGGCNTWVVRPGMHAFVREFERLAAELFPTHPEPNDTLVGELWDAAMLALEPVGGEE